MKEPRAETLRVARGSQSRLGLFVVTGGVGGCGPQTVSKPPLSGDGC
jgi:hypothetical protein